MSGTRRRSVVTVAGAIPPDLDAAVTSGRRPRADYREVAARLDADIIDQASAAVELGRAGRLLARVGGPDAVIAAALWRRRRHVDIVLTDSERVGFPYAVMTALTRRRPRHVMIAHRLSTPGKQRLHRWLRLGRRIDHVLVYASSQAAVAHQLGYRPDQVTRTTFMVDTEFWRPEVGREEDSPFGSSRPLVAAVGQELRDYPTLVEAVRDLGVDVVIAAASPWSRRADSSARLDLPPNVRVVGLDLFELRQLYLAADIVVVPVVETDFQAGITSILEAMAMGRAVICTRTAGQTDTVVDDHTGCYVPVGDVAALRAAIDRLTSDVPRRQRLADTGREWVRSAADIEVYADRVAGVARFGATSG